MKKQEEQFLNSLLYRKSIIAEIKGSENKMRMQSSLQDCDIYNGKIRPYVTKYLNSRFNASTVKEMPIVASVNVTRKLVDQKASLYKQCPDRDFNGASESLDEEIESIYGVMQVDSKLLESNRMFELQSHQSHVMVIPKNRKLHMRVLKNHQLNVVVSEEDPEAAVIYLISSFDKSLSNLMTQNSDYQNEKIGDSDDYKAMTDRYIVWSENLHLVVDGNGSIISETTENPIAPVVPIVEVAPDSKDFEYWIQGIGEDVGAAFCGGGELSNFTVEYNAALSSLGQICNMQGFAQAYLKAPENLQPTTITIGPNHILRLITDPTNGKDDTEFGYANPNSDLAGVQSYTQSLLSQFLSSQGLDPKTITGSTDSVQNFSSGVERLLAMVSQFEASKETMAVYQNAEIKLFNVIKSWCNASLKLDILDPEFQVSIPESCTVSIEYKRPEMVESEKEKLDIIQQKIDMGIYSLVDAIAETENKSTVEARDRLKEIESDSMINVIPQKPLPVRPPKMPMEEMSTDGIED